MERGLLWLPLLIMFFWLAYAGWNEYQKLEAYQRWAPQFERAKYDIFAVLGQQGDTLTWGKPTRQEPANIETLALSEVRSLQLFADNQPIDPEHLPRRSRRAALTFTLPERVVSIPFTDVAIAAQWHQFLQQRLQPQSSTSP
ncbi:MAG: hypothetical protein KME20_17640 [Kaiparowitsia implicata GSE-PSE-MK54-09C]|jgi:hypothetical protein|nr:hypothetical protein [Kaiparowitsia implicata GSE-PSE-MK54-09C]